MCSPRGISSSSEIGYGSGTRKSTTRTRIGHGGVSQLGNGHCQEIIIVLGKGTLGHGVRIFPRMKNAHDSVTGLRLEPEGELVPWYRVPAMVPERMGCR